MLSEAILRKTKGFTQQKSLQHAAVLFSGKAGVHLIALISQPVLARLYSPAQFGEFAFLNSLLAILLVAASGRYEAGIVLTRKPQHAKRLFQLSQLVLAVYIALLGLLLILLPKSLQQWIFGQGLPAAYLWLIPVLILCAGYWELVHHWLVRFQRYSSISLALIIQRLLLFGGAMAAAAFSVPGNGLIYGLLAGSLGIFIISLILQKEPVRLRLKGLKTYAHHFREFPYFSVPTLFTSLLIQHLPVLWIIFFFNKNMAGTYSLANALVMIPVTGLSMSIGQVFYARLAQSPAHRKKSLIKKACFSYALILIPPVLVIFYWGEPIIEMLLGSRWQQTGEFISLLAPITLALGLNSCLLIALNASRKQSAAFGLQLLKLLLWIGALSTGIIFQDIIIVFKLMAFLSFIHLFFTIYILKNLKII